MRSEGLNVEIQPEATITGSIDFNFFGAAKKLQFDNGKGVTASQTF